MKLVVVADRSRAHDRAHARVQATRLRRAGFNVLGFARESSWPQQDPIAVHAVGAGAWRSARRLARRHGVPVVYDHPPGTVPPSKLRSAERVIAAGHADAMTLANRLGAGGRLVVVPPDPPRPGTGIRPRLRRRLGIEGRVLALQEAAGASRRQAEALVRTIALLPDVELALLGGERWRHRAALTAVAEETPAAGRVHFVGDVPTARRLDYLTEADVGLAFAGEEQRRGCLPAADAFDMLGIPFVAPADCADSMRGICIASTDDPTLLRAAIAEARNRGRVPAREDGAQILEQIFVELAAAQGGPGDTEGNPLSQARRSAAGQASAVHDEAAAAALLGRAKVLRDRGEAERAIELYGQLAGGPYPAPAIAAAAAALALSNAREEARVAIDRIANAPQRSPLTAARAGEAAALLGDLTQARSLANEALTDPDRPEAALRVALRVLEKSGEPRAALRVAREIDDRPSIARIEGVLRSYEPAWLPAAGRSGTPQRPAAGSCFTLLETSLPYARSGYTYRARTLLRAQRHAGLEPIALTRLGFPATRGLSSPTAEEVDGVLHCRAGLAGVKHYTSVPMPEQLDANVRWAAALAREHRPEGVIATTPHLNGLVGLALRRALGVPLIYDVRGFPEMTWAVRNGGRDTDAFGLRRVAETRCMREADLVTTLSETMRRHIVGRGIAPAKVFVLPHAVDTDEFAPQHRDHELAASLGIADRSVVGYISSLVAYEGVETLLEAVALARRKDPGIACLIVGSGDRLPSLRARAARLGLDGSVVFTGRIDSSEIARFYSLMDVFVCPRQDHEVTRHVTPLKPFEAMAAGCCVAVSDLPALREAVQDGECGDVFPAGAAEALARTILALVEEPERRRGLETAAREHVLARHGFDSLCAGMEEVWAELRLRAGSSKDAETPSGRSAPVFIQ